MNKERFLELADIIENAPKDQFHLGAWFGERNFKYDTWMGTNQYCGPLGRFFSQSPNEMKCGTTACIAGWALAMKYNFDPKLDLNGAIEDVAAEYLGLTQHEAYRLFFANQDSVWARHQEEYGYKVVEYSDDYEDSEYVMEIDPDQWDVTNKDAAHMLRRIANGQVEL